MMPVNINYFLDQHGWSTCWIHTPQKSYEITITHAFAKDPIIECLNALIQIINGERIAFFDWHGEPNGDRISLEEIPTKKHVITFKLESFDCDYPSPIENLKLVLAFEIKKIQLIRIFYFEFKKIAELLKDKAFAKHRQNDFPFEVFKQFEQKAILYIGL